MFNAATGNMWKGGEDAGTTDAFLPFDVYSAGRDKHAHKRKTPGKRR
jgi:hypothetical protein